MKILSTTNVYVHMKGKAPPKKSTFFRDVGSEKSHIRVKVALDEVSPQCTFGVFAVNEEQKALPLAMFEFFQFSVADNEFYSLRATSLQGHTIFLGPEIRHVKEASLFFRPSANLCGQSVFLHISCFENRKMKEFCDSGKTHIARPILWNPQHQRIVQLKGSVWQRSCPDRFPVSDDTDVEAEIFARDYRVLVLEQELLDCKEKFQLSCETSDCRRCSECFDPLTASYSRSVYWVAEEESFEKLHCQKCQPDAEGCRRALMDWYWHRAGSHCYSQRVVVTHFNEKGLCLHRTLQELADEFRKSLYQSEWESLN